MSATEELRRMLDERGVEYYRHEEDEPLRELKEGTDRATSWRLGKASCTVVECEDGTLDVWIDHATPAQAIEATLGRGELEQENKELRELVRDYDRVLDAAVDVWGIMADVLGYGSKYDALHDRMRELGIEVDE